MNKILLIGLLIVSLNCNAKIIETPNTSMKCETVQLSHSCIVICTGLYKGAVTTVAPADCD